MSKYKCNNCHSVFDGSQFSKTDWTVNPLLDLGPWSSPQDSGADSQEHPFPNTNWLPADDQNLDQQAPSNVAASLNKKAIMKEARTDAISWIDPSGKIYTFSDNSHDTWAEANAEMLKTQYNVDLTKMNPNTDSSMSYLIDNGWTRAAVADTVIVFTTKDASHLSQLDDYVAQNWQPNFDYVLVETYNGTWKVQDPFPSLQKTIQHSEKVAKQASINGQITNNILQNIHNAGGTTYNLAKGDMVGTPNFAISIYPEREKIVEDGILDFELLENYLHDNEDLLKDSNNSFGAWNNQGKVYLDVVVTIPDRAKAIELANQHNQLAIWDLQNAKEISTKKQVEPVIRAFSKKGLVKVAEEQLLTEVDQNAIAATSSPAYVIAVNNYAEALKRGHSKDRSLEYAIESVQNLEKVDPKKLVEFINKYVVI